MIFEQFEGLPGHIDLAKTLRYYQRDSDFFRAGDGYPDIRNGSSIEFTGPRGAKAATTGTGDNPYDLGVAVGGGLNGSAISVGSSGNTTINNDGDGADGHGASLGKGYRG